MVTTKLRKPNPKLWDDHGISSDRTREIFDELLPLYGIYRAASREMSTRLEVLDDEFQLRHSRNPIHHLHSRIKTPQSILAKLERRNYPITLDSILNNITDIAGIRVICSYIDDVYEIAKMIELQDDIQILRKADYIASPKPNGYRSLHMVVNVPVYLSDGKSSAPVEVQIRTIAMDFWASLEHDLYYKSGGSVDPTIAQNLHECSSAIASIDQRMQSIAQAAAKLSIEKGRLHKMPQRDPWEPRRSV